MTPMACPTRRYRNTNNPNSMLAVNARKATSRANGHPKDYPTVIDGDSPKFKYVNSI
jgi:hypothetical protein